MNIPTKLKLIKLPSSSMSSIISCSCCDKNNTTIQYNFIDLRRRNCLLVKLRDRDAGWKDQDGCLKGRVEQMTFYTTLKNNDKEIISFDVLIISSVTTKYYGCLDTTDVSTFKILNVLSYVISIVSHIKTLVIPLLLSPDYTS